MFFCFEIFLKILNLNHWTFFLKKIIKHVLFSILNESNFIFHFNLTLLFTTKHTNVEKISKFHISYHSHRPGLARARLAFIPHQTQPNSRHMSNTSQTRRSNRRRRTIVVRRRQRRRLCLRDGRWFVWFGDESTDKSRWHGDFEIFEFFELNLFFLYFYWNSKEIKSTCISSCFATRYGWTGLFYFLFFTLSNFKNFEKFVKFHYLWHSARQS